MNRYGFKIQAWEWIFHSIEFIIMVTLAFLTGSRISKQGLSFETVVLHIIIISAFILRFYILNKRRHAFVEIDNYSIRYEDFRTNLNISFTDIAKIERTKWNPSVVTLFTGGKKHTIPLQMTEKDKFLNHLVSVIENIRYKIEYDRDNILNYGKK